MRIKRRKVKKENMTATSNSDSGSDSSVTRKKKEALAHKGQ